jgi:DNA helicase II / ATP-dependent DNA helicase PcrA
MKGTCLSIYSRTVNAEAPLGEVLESVFPWCAEWEAELRRLFAAYVEAKQKQNVLDYDDLLLYWAQMMSEASFAEDLSARFDHVLVDEYQDTNRLQAAILLALKPDGKSLTVVGDDAQSIYSFRAATVRNILDFPGEFSPKAEVITLERNYRSTQPILAAANAVIDFASERFTKNLWSDRPSAARPCLVHVADDAGQAGYVAETVLANRETGIRLKSQAILFRASHHSATLIGRDGSRDEVIAKYRAWVVRQYFNMTWNRLRHVRSCRLTMACVPSKGTPQAPRARAQGIPRLSIHTDLTWQDGL